MLFFAAPFPPQEEFLPRMLKNLSAVAPKLPREKHESHPKPFPKKYLLWGFQIGRGCVLKNADWWNTLAAFADRLAGFLWLQIYCDKIHKLTSSNIGSLALLSSIHMI